MHLRDITAGDADRILALNAAEVRQTSAMDDAQLRALLGVAAYGKVATDDDAVVAFLIALRDRAPDGHDNHAWFAAQLPAFLYVDRIVVAAHLAGRGIGRRLYEDLFAFARAQGIATVACEYNLDPPNPASRAFHERFGFREIGTRRTADGAKRVSMQRADLR